MVLAITVTHSCDFRGCATETSLKSDRTNGVRNAGELPPGWVEIAGRLYCSRHEIVIRNKDGDPSGFGALRWREEYDRA